MGAYSDLWLNAENACFRYLLTKLGSTDKRDGFLGATPAGMINAWQFGFDGGPESPLTGGCGARIVASWQVDAAWTGYYGERKDAINAAGIIMEQLPAGKNHGAKGGVAARPVPYVQTFRVVRPPNVASQWWELSNSNQSHLITVVNIPLTVVFDITE